MPSETRECERTVRFAGSKSEIHTAMSQNIKLVVLRKCSKSQWNSLKIRFAM